ncbi:MAG: DUF115 domain-containing protein [Firmicutes bacterium]|nr:DUF115 domain-containing protein [Bacillota bacterium]
MKKLALFGAGDIAGQLLDILGEELIEFFFCNNKEKEELGGKPVISYGEFLKRKESVITVVASTKYDLEMAAQLERNGVNSFFVWDLSIHKIFCKERMLDFPRYTPIYSGQGWEHLPFSLIRSFYHYDLSSYNRIFIYAYPEVCEALLRLLHSVGKEKNVLCVAHPGEVAERTLNLLIDSIDCVLCAVRREDNEICNEYEHISSITTIDLYDIAAFVPEFHSPMVRPLKDRYRGKRCFLIGNGPSLKIEDLDKLHEHDEITFACNKIYNAFKHTQWRPDFYVMMDVWVLRSDMKNILNVMPKVCSFYNYAFCNGTVLYSNDENVIPLYHLPEQPDNAHYTRFSKDVSICHCDGRGTVYTMLQIAYYLGFEEVYLIGCDHYSASLKETGKVDHFYDSEKDVVWKMLPDYTKIDSHRKLNKSFEAARLIFEEEGRKIYNATRGGYLDVFERVDFDELL